MRKAINILAPIALAVMMIYWIVNDNALLSAFAAFVLAGNLMIDLVDWADGRKS